MNKTVLHVSTSLLIAMAVTGAAYSQEVSTDPLAAAVSVAVEEEGVPGGVYLDAVKITAAVTAIDAELRSVTVVGPEGNSTSFIAGPEVINFDQISVGDQITVALMSEMVVSLRKAGTSAESEGGLLVARAAEGDKPAGIIAGTTEITAVVESINLEEHAATLKLPDGESKTIKAREDVDLTQVTVGDEVVISLTEAIAVMVETP